MTCWLSGERSLPFGLLFFLITPDPSADEPAVDNPVPVPSGKAGFFMIRLIFSW